MSFYKASDIFKQSKSKIKKQAQAAHICYLAQKILQKFFPQNQARIFSFKNGILNIQAQNPLTAFEIKLQSEDLKYKINQELQKTQKLKKDLIQKIVARA